MAGDAIKRLPAALTDSPAAPLLRVLTELAAALDPSPSGGPVAASRSTPAWAAPNAPIISLIGDALDGNMTDNYRAILALPQARKEVGGLAF